LLKKLTILPEQTVYRNKPANLADEDISIFNHEFAKQLEPCVLYEIKDANVLGDTVFTIKGFRFFSKHTNVFNLSLIHKLNRLKWFLRPIQKVEKVLWATDDWSIGYFHWMADTLPRIIAAEKHGKSIPLLIPDSYNIRYITETLSIIKQPYQFYNPKKRLYARELVLISHLAVTGNYAPQYMIKMRELFVSAVKQKSTSPYLGNKLYVSRKKANYRKILNEFDLFPVLEKYGFKVVYFEDYDICEQITIMTGCEYLVGLHGANLTNMIFMPSGGKVFEMRNKNDNHNNCYYSLTQSLGLHYYYSMNQASSHITAFANFTVDVNLFEKTIIEMTTHN
jgi:hypothetical protein